MSRNNDAEIDVEVLAVGEHAIKVTDGDTSAWIPYSLIHDDSSIMATSRKGDTGTLVIPQWKAEEVKFV